MGVDELLIHVSGPSSRKDDNRFRALAKAYDLFETAKTARLDMGNDCAPLLQMEAHLKRHAPLQTSSRAASSTESEVTPQVLRTLKRPLHDFLDGQADPAKKEQGSIEFIEDTQLAIAAQQSQLWTSSLGPQTYSPASQRSQRTPKRARASGTVESDIRFGPSGSASASVGSNGSESSWPPRPTPNLHRAEGNIDERGDVVEVPEALEDRREIENPRSNWRQPSSPGTIPLEHSLESDLSEEVFETPIARPTAREEVNNTSDREMAAAEETSKRASTTGPGPSPDQTSTFNSNSALLVPSKIQHRCPPTEDPILPLGQSTALSTKPSSPPFTSGFQQPQPTTMSNVPSASTPVFQTPQERPSKERQEASSPFQPLSRHQITTVAPTALPPPSKEPSSSVPTSSGPLSVTIQAPPPQASHAPPPTPTSLITPSLAQLIANPALSRAYKPVNKTRALQDMERGHWRFDTHIWGKELAEEFWRYMEIFVGEGRAGWGVWCGREGPEDEHGDIGKVEHARGNGEEQGAEGVKDARTTLGKVRIYCWGIAVPHIYLLLYVASKSRIKKCGAEWVDAEGTVVVAM